MLQGGSIKLYQNPLHLLSQEELWKKYENVINKVKHNKELTDMEALDMAFVSKFIAPQHKEFIIDSMTKSFKAAIISDEKLKMDVAIILDAMITKQFSSKTKQNELKERINMREYKNEMEKIIYEGFGDELYEKDKELQTQKQENEKVKQENKKLSKTNKEYKNKIHQLTQMEDLNTPEAKKIINSLMLL